MIADPQVPAPGEVFLDHVGWFVPDMAAALAFERLGFVLTPYIEHRNTAPDGTSVASGTANRCAMLERGYLEFLTAVPGCEAPLARQLRAGLTQRRGVHIVAFTVAEATAERARLAQAGFDPEPVVHLRRPVPAAGGIPGTASFSVLRVPPAQMPEGRIQFLVQETPELVWQRDLIARENAVHALTGVLLVVADPAEVADRYARFIGRGQRTLRDDGALIVLDRGRVAFAGPASPWATAGAPAPSLPCVTAVALLSRDLAATRDDLRRRGTRLAADAADHLIVHADEAAGTALLIHAAGAEDRLHER